MRGPAMQFELTKRNKKYVSQVDKNLLKTLYEEGQRPKAIVISCSDSRVPVEIVFDAPEPGTFFVIRVAGNVVYGPIVIGSIEFAIRQLKTPSIVLLGHTGCGAVKAHIDGAAEGEMVAQLCTLISCRSRDLSKAVVENLEQQFRNLLKVACVQEGIRAGSLEAYAMLYDLQTGTVKTHRRA